MSVAEYLGIPDGRRTLVMGIINVTPDSFYANSRVSETDLLKKVEEMIEAGVAIIDVGGESTRPGAEPVPLDEELRRVVPAVNVIKKHFSIPVSVDTYKAEVAKAALEHGADMVNDISALRFDQRMVDVVAHYDCPVVLMHMKGEPRTMQLNPEYGDVVREIVEFLRERIAFAQAHGIRKIIVDPGIGFGKKLEHNLQILAKLDEFKVLGYPLLVGASRKSMIGALLGNVPPEARLNGTLAVTAYCVLKGVDIVRVHDVRENVEVVKVLEAILATTSDGGRC